MIYSHNVNKSDVYKFVKIIYTKYLFSMFYKPHPFINHANLIPFFNVL